jgi:hypothetical protein
MGAAHPVCMRQLPAAQGRGCSLPWFLLNPCPSHLPSWQQAQALCNHCKEAVAAQVRTLAVGALQQPACMVSPAGKQQLPYIAALESSCLLRG